MVAAGLVFAQAVFCVDNVLGNTISLVDFLCIWLCLWYNPKNGILEFGAYIGLVKYLLWQCAMWTTFGKHNYFDLFSNIWCKHFEQDASYLSLEHFNLRTTYWNLVPTGEVFALAVCYVDNFWETQLL